MELSLATLNLREIPFPIHLPNQAMKCNDVINDAYKTLFWGLKDINIVEAQFNSFLTSMSVLYDDVQIDQ